MFAVAGEDQQGADVGLNVTSEELCCLVLYMLSNILTSNSVLFKNLLYRCASSQEDVIIVHIQGDYLTKLKISEIAL